jgi:hypothetical protein
VIRVWREGERESDLADSSEKQESWTGGTPWVMYMGDEAIILPESIVDAM